MAFRLPSDVTLGARFAAAVPVW